jgi:hypothetical protein
MSTDEKIKELESRIQEHEFKQATLIAIEKNNRKWILGISTIIFGVLGISYLQLPQLIYDSVDKQIDATAQERLSTLLLEAEVVAGKIQVNGAEADQKTRKLLALTNQATELVERLKGIKVSDVSSEPGMNVDAKSDPVTAASGGEEPEPEHVVTDPNIEPPSSENPGSNKQEQWVTLFENYYAKSNYYLPFGGNLRINVMGVENNGVKVNIVSLNNDYQKEATLVPNGTTPVTYNDVEYLITLDKVDNAGFNPLTKAAFFKVQQKL